MNDPIPPELKGRYSLVVDGGTLEHVFNVPQAFRNCMEMLQVGGFFVSSGPCNNQMGHGFWQFSPELPYRIFCPINGFETVAVFVQEASVNFWKEGNGPFYLVRDPAELGARVELRNSRPTFLHVIARKTADQAVFSTAPQQSDYRAVWDRAAFAVSPARGFSPARLAKAITPAMVKRALKPRFPRDAYQPYSALEVMRGAFFKET